MAKEESELVPEGLVTCLLDETEVSIVKLSPQRLTIRLSEELENKYRCSSSQKNINDKECGHEYKPIIKAAFYVFHEYGYKEVVLKDYKIIEKTKNEFYVTYTFLIDNKEFSDNVRNIFKDYTEYVRMKNYGIDNEFSQEMVGYPAEKDYDFYSYYSDAKREWMTEIDYINDGYTEKVMDHIELAVSLHDDELYKRYLETDIKSFKHDYLSENYAEKYGLFSKDICRVYIGNEFCHNLSPNINQLIKMMNKAKSEKLEITICFTYMRDCFIDSTKECIDKLYDWCSKNNMLIEIVVNDWGMLEILKNKMDYFILSLGVLLNKRKKDPRYIYKKGYGENKNLMAQNSTNSEIFTQFLKENNIKRYEYENCGYKMDIAEGKHSLHMPFYVTNISQYCPLYAMCENQDRGKQELVNECPKYCRDYVFSYPKHLKMVGRYNSLFSFDDTLFKDKVMLEYYLKNGIDRIVLNFM